MHSTGIPARALDGYREAASLVNAADPGCNIDWALLAAIGSVESNHARFGGNELDSAGVAQPGIIGIALNGSNQTARITDSDGGLLDRDSAFDRAVGPMQFIPSTWRIAGADADGDGVKNPQDMADAATASAIYLCSGPGDLSQPGDLRAAIMRYNASDSYARNVTAIAGGYRQGVNALPAFDRPARSSVTTTYVAPAGTKASNDRPFKATSTSAARNVSASTTPRRARKSAHTDSARPAAPRPNTSATAKSTPAKSAPAKSTPAKSTPAKSTPAKSTPAKSTPATPTTPDSKLPDGDEDGRHETADEGRDDDGDEDGSGNSGPGDGSGNSGPGDGSGDDD